MSGDGPQYVPKFKDILEYLDYLKLDEPIVGLECLVELPSDSLSGPNYTCTLCCATTNISEMVNHVIGRKHRQRYVEVKRKDLVTWDTEQFQKKGGKVIRAKAEIIERQDGRGCPKTSVKSEVVGKLSNKKAQPSIAPNKNKWIPQKSELVPPLLPEFRNYHKPSPNQRVALGFQNPPMFHPDEEAMDRQRQLDMNDSFGFNHREEGLHRAENMGSQVFREGDLYSPHDPYDEPFAKDPIRGAPFGSSFLPRAEYREEMPRDRNDPFPFYQDRNPFEEAFPEREAPREYFHQGDHGQVYRPEYEQTQMYSKGENWSRERDHSDYDHLNRSPRQDLSEPEPKRRILSSSIDGGDRLCSIIKDYRHQKQRPHQEEPRKEVEAAQTISDIPEPFKKFLSRASNDNPGKRKRVSRFTDASAEEVKMTNEMMSGSHGSLHGNFNVAQRRANVPLRPETEVPLYSEQYRELQNLKYTESHQREAPDSQSVFDMLQNVEINTAEEAELLKSKLCSLLREFKSKGLEKTKSPNREYDLKTYDYPKQEPQQLRQQYERTMRKSSNPGPQDTYFEDRGRALNQRGHTPEGMQQDFPHSSRGEPRHRNRSSYEALERVLNSNLDKPPYRAERFQEPLRSWDYKSPGEEPYDPFTMEEEYRTQRDTRYSNSLEKITSTLLELVSRK
ncbi:uncharacterized protein LOC114472332 isoform X2 [Gouania willdenowi]|nr:uncharacterized protein LOC114472332 isoform X2 [Gouania willdenowi]